MMHDPNKPLPNSEYNFDWLLKPIIAFFKTYFSFPKIWVEEYVEETGQRSFYVVKQTALLFCNKYINREKLDVGGEMKEWVFYTDYNSKQYAAGFPTFEEAEQAALTYIAWVEDQAAKTKAREQREKAEKLRIKQIKTGTIKRTQIK